VAGWPDLPACALCCGPSRKCQVEYTATLQRFRSRWLVRKQQLKHLLDTDAAQHGAPWRCVQALARRPA